MFLGALEDFDKLPKASTKTENPKNDATTRETDEPLEVLGDDAWSQDFIKETADKLEKKLQTLMQNG